MSADYVVPDRYDRYLKDTTRELQTGTWTSNPYSRRNMMNVGNSSSTSPSPTRVSPHKMLPSSSTTSPLTKKSSSQGLGAVDTLPPIPVSPRSFQTKTTAQGESGGNVGTIWSSPPNYLTKQPNKLCFSRFLPHDLNDVNYLIEKSATPHFLQPSSARIRSQSPTSRSSLPSSTDNGVAVVPRQVLTDKEELQLELPSIVSSSPNKSRGGAVPTSLFTSKLDKFNAEVYTGGLNCRQPHSDEDENPTTTTTTM